MYISLNQVLDDNNKIYMKYGKNEDTLINQHASIGWSHSSLFDAHDLLLTSLSTSQSSDTSKFQTTVEVLYKYKFDYGIELSADIQVIQNLNADEDIATIAGLRFNIVF